MKVLIATNSPPDLNSFHPLSEQTLAGVMQPGRDFFALGFSNWALVEEVGAMAQLQLLCSAPCWLTLFFPG